MVHLHIKRSGQVASRIRHEQEHGEANLLVLGPGLHYGGVVDAIHNHVADSQLAQCVLVRKIVGNLLCGSGRSAVYEDSE